MWIERGPQLRNATNAEEFDAKLKVWMQPLTSIITESKQIQQQVVAVAAVMMEEPPCVRILR